MRRLFVSVLMVLSFAIPAQANDFAVVLGFRSNNADVVDIPANTGSTAKSSTSFQAGVLGFFDFTEVIGMRAGFVYAQRNYIIENATTETKFKTGYFDIPATFTYKIADYARIFAGPLLALNVSDDCEVSGGVCTVTKSPESMSLGLQLGASFKFAPQFGGEIYYELIPSEFWKDGLENSKSVGANLLVTFE